MVGPVAPKDPEKKRTGFYVMKNKEIFGAPWLDGRGVNVIPLDYGRLEASAKIEGNIEDEKILELLSTAAGFKKLVHSIGVSVDASPQKCDVNFAFQIYGKSDPKVTGTTLNMRIPADGMEYVYDLSKADFSGDDNIPGEFRFEFDTQGIMARASVTLYVNDGYEVPEQTEDEPVDFSSQNYKDMIGKSLIQTGNTYRLKTALDRARMGEDITIAFIGGSITQGAGAIPINTGCYAYKTFEGLCKMLGKGTDENIHYVKAGVGGTPSELGILRYDNDVLHGGKTTPDIVVVEFAVNDEGDETKGKFYDSLVRRIYNGPGHPAVILLYAVFANDWNLEDKLGIVGEAYNLPMVSTKRSVVDQFYYTKEQGNILAKNQFFYDLFHPTNLGHTIMADGIINLFDVVMKMDGEGESANETLEWDDCDISNITPPFGNEFENVIFFDRKSVPDYVKIDAGDFTNTDTDVHYVEYDCDLEGSPVLINNWQYKGGGNNAVFKLELICKGLMVVYKDSASASVGSARVYVDGKNKVLLDPHEVGWTHSTPKIVFIEDVAESHVIEIIAKENLDFTVQGFGVIF